jgi:hypothetical protein
VAVVRGLTGGGGEWWRGVQAAAAVLLGRPGPAALQRRSGMPGMAGAPGAPHRRCRARSGTRGEMVSSGR